MNAKYGSASINGMMTRWPLGKIRDPAAELSLCALPFSMITSKRRDIDREFRLEQQPVGSMRRNREIANVATRSFAMLRAKTYQFPW